MKTYQQLATKWFPDNEDNSTFLVIVLVTVVVLSAMTLFISTIDTPEKERTLKRDIPERVAKFIDQRKKPTPPPPKPIEPPKPPPKPKPKVAREKPLDKEKKPLTEQQQKARDKAQNSGILAIASELTDLMDTSSIDASVSKSIKSVGKNAKTAVNRNENSLTEGVGQGSGGVGEKTVGQAIGSTAISQQELAQIHSGIGKRDRTDADNQKAITRSSNGRTRSEEELSVVFDQNKAKLYREYNRARQKNIALKGRLIIELTISAQGKVTSARIVSSELGDPRLERKILARVKGFKFKARDVEPITVTYPIEFVPS